MTTPEVHTINTIRGLIDAGYCSIGDVMSNLDHSIEPDAEKRLKAGKHAGEYCAWNFHAWVWWTGKNYGAIPEQWGVELPAIFANSLQEIMDQLSERFGAE